MASSIPVSTASNFRQVHLSSPSVLSLQPRKSSLLQESESDPELSDSDAEADGRVSNRDSRRSQRPQRSSSRRRNGRTGLPARRSNRTRQPNPALLEDSDDQVRCKTKATCFRNNNLQYQLVSLHLHVDAADVIRLCCRCTWMRRKMRTGVAGAVAAVW